MHPHVLELLYQRLGRPPWFWPAVFAALFAGAPLLTELFQRTLP